MSSSSEITLAAAQIQSVLCDVDANIGKHLDVIAQAKQAGADLVQFPELSLTGYHVKDAVPDVAMTKEDPRLLELAEAAGDMTVICGFVEEGYAAQFYNSAVVLWNGGVQFVHRKLNLPSYGTLEEDKHFAEGRYLEPVFLKEPWTASLLICADAWNPALVHMGALEGATMLLCPIASSGISTGQFSNASGWTKTLDFYAMIYGMPVVMTNYCGEIGDVSFWGGSRILDAYGNTIAQAENEECVITATVDYADVRRARFQLPTVRDSNLDLITREITRLSQRVGVPNAVRRPSGN